MKNNFAIKRAIHKLVKNQGEKYQVETAICGIKKNSQAENYFYWKPGLKDQCKIFRFLQLILIVV
jgi:hypothetical protein